MSFAQENGKACFESNYLMLDMVRYRNHNCIEYKNVFCPLL